MQLIYVQHLKGYVDLESKYYPGEVYTDDDLDQFLELERKWRESLPEHNFYELIKIYPSAKNAMKKNIVEKQKFLKDRKKKFLSYIEDGVMKLFGQMDNVQTIEISKQIEKEKEDYLEEIKKEEAKLKFQKEYLNRLLKEESVRNKIEKAKKKIEKEKDESKLEQEKQKLLEAEQSLSEAMDYHPQDGITPEMIDRARAVPISNFVKVGRDGKMRCLKHNEKTPSMHIYKRKNNFYCFSCGFHGSVIDIIMEMQGLDFKGAVKYLNNI